MRIALVAGSYYADATMHAVLAGLKQAYSSRGHPNPLSLADARAG